MDVSAERYGVYCSWSVLKYQPGIHVYCQMEELLKELSGSGVDDSGSSATT
jgi:hypothetical protein